MICKKFGEIRFIDNNRSYGLVVDDLFAVNISAYLLNLRGKKRLNIGILFS